MIERVPINYKQHKAIFQSIKLEERSAWTQKMLQTKQLRGDYLFYEREYPNHQKWDYKGEKLHYYSYLNDTQPSKAILFFFPGMNEHAETSAYFAMSIAQKCAIDIYGLDYKNFGRSSGQHRGYLSSGKEIIEQAEDFVSFILSQQKDKKKVFISGSSLGGAVCFKLSLRHPQRYDGVIFLSPALRENKNANAFLKIAAKIIGYLFPRLKLINQIMDDNTKYDQQKRTFDDKNIYTGRIIPGTIKAVLDLMEQTQKQWNKFTTPFILIQSGVDKSVDPFQALDFEKQCSSKDKTVVYFKDMWHGVLFEEQIPDVIEAVSQWMVPRVNQ